MHRLAYYAHHHGSGHIRHALNVAGGNFEMLLLTGASVPNDLPSNVTVAPLTSDLVDNHVETDGSPFLYSPVGINARGVKDRFWEIHEALRTFDPEVVITDVSPEVTAFVKLAGYPVITRRMHGERNDYAHGVAYAAADAIVAYYPNAFEAPDYPDDLARKTFHLGVVPPTSPTKLHSVGSEKVVTVLTSLGGEGVTMEEVNTAATQTPDWQWSVLGLASGTEAPAENVQALGVVPDPSAFLASSAVVVTSAGHNAISATVAAGAPMVVVPEPRPFHEQRMYAQTLASVAGVVSTDTWSADWPSLLEQACRGNATGQLAEMLLVTRSQYLAQLNRAIDFALGEGSVGADRVDVGSGGDSKHH